MQHHPLPEYPRPALRRDSYENLNGLWQYAITGSAGLPAKWDGDILVPYSPETKASGVGRTLQPGAWLHYHRSFVPPAGTGGRVLLHFGAVDYACAVQVNGHLVGGHRGGYWPFALDITDALNPAGHDRLWVAVQDPTGTGVQARGKQTLRPGGMFYPAQSGIWQTVWLERVPENYITELTVTPDYDARTVTVKARVIRSEGGFVWACKNYDGDVMSDMVSTAFGSLAMMTSVLVSPDGNYEYEAAHGTVTRHYYKYLKGEATSTNPMATIFAWSGALKKRGELDSLPALVRFGEALEAASLQTLNDGIMTKDLCGLAEGITPTQVNSEEFIQAIRTRLEAKLA